jgi:hypothetical protein
MKLRVVALVAGHLGPVELWTLRALASEPCEFMVIQASQPTGLSTRKRLERLRAEIGVVRLLSRVLGNRLLGRWENRGRDRSLELLFDGEDLRSWWRALRIQVVSVPFLNHDATRQALLDYRADVVVRVSGGVLSRKIFSAARIATLNIHHGIAPRVRGMWSIPWGLIEDRPDWIGATIHVIDEGIDTGAVLWRGAPQIAPGDTGTTLFFRAHLEAVQSLVAIVREYACGAPRIDRSSPAPEPGVYRSAPEVGHWIRYLITARGRRSATVLRTAIEC